MYSEADIAKMLKEVHALLLKNNEHDEGDLLYHRIRYRLMDTFGLTKEAETQHSKYHIDNPRRVSKGFCDKCGQTVVIIPVIYGVQEGDLKKMQEAETQGRLIIGDINLVMQGSKMAMFGCKTCKALLPKYGSG